MATLRLFASVREAVGERTVAVDGETVADVIAEASATYGPRFAALVDTCRVWVNGAPAEPDTPVAETDEVALLPPVSGG